MASTSDNPIEMTNSNKRQINTPVELTRQQTIKSAGYDVRCKSCFVKLNLYRRKH
jgi:hypothetical protein